jgi:hypothetical protein
MRHTPQGVWLTECFGLRPTDREVPFGFPRGGSSASIARVMIGELPVPGVVIGACDAAICRLTEVREGRVSIELAYTLDCAFQLG